MLTIALVANFRSIRMEQVLSLVSSRADKELETSLIDVTLPGMAKTRYLRSAAIYGHNASGKTNILLAFEYVIGLVMNSAVGLKPGDGTGTEPFKLDLGPTFILLQGRCKPSGKDKRQLAFPFCRTPIQRRTIDDSCRTPRPIPRGLIPAGLQE